MSKVQAKNLFLPLQKSLLSQLDEVMIIDQRRLSARIKGIGHIKSEEGKNAVATEIQQQIQLAQARYKGVKVRSKIPSFFLIIYRSANVKQKFKS